MALGYVQISGEFLDAQGSPLNGTVTFTPNVTVYAAGIPVLQADVPVSAMIAGGQMENEAGGVLRLLATDQEGLSFEGQTGFVFYTVCVTLAGEVLRPWSFFLPGSPDTVDLYSLANTPASGGGGVQIGGDLGGTDDSPEVISTHLGSPMPVVQGGTGAASAPAALTALGAASAAALASEVSRAESAESGLSTAISGETSRAETAEGILSTAVSAETTRAEAAEAQLVPKSGSEMGGWLAPKVVTLSQSGGSVAVNAAGGNAFNLALTASGWTIAAPTNPADGQVIRFRIQQDATGGRTVTWAAGSGGYDFGTTGTPTLSTAANAVDVIGFEFCALNSRWNCAGSALGF